MHFYFKQQQISYEQRTQISFKRLKNALRTNKTSRFYGKQNN